MTDSIHSTPIPHATGSATLLDVLDRILDKGVVIAGDISIKLVDVELLTIHIRLLVCSVDKAREMGMDWWLSDAFRSGLSQRTDAASSIAAAPAAPAALDALEARLATLEQVLKPMPR